MKGTIFGPDHRFSEALQLESILLFTYLVYDYCLNFSVAFGLHGTLSRTVAQKHL